MEEVKNSIRLQERINNLLKNKKWGHLTFILINFYKVKGKIIRLIISRLALSVKRCISIIKFFNFFAIYDVY